jgi:hypothetical protein
MKTMRILNLGFAILGLFLAATILAFLARTSHAQGPIQMGLDMETTGNTASALGPIARCHELTWSGTPFDGVADWTIDVYVAGDTLSPLAYDAWVTYDNAKVHVLQAAPTDPLIKMPGAMNLSGYQVGQASFGAIYLNPPYNGIPGDGTLVRVGLDIGASGIVAFGFAKGAYISAPGSLQHPVTTVGGQVAVNEGCPAAPTPTPPPSVGGTIEISAGGSDTSAGSAAADSSADSSAWYYAALAGGAAMVILAVASGAWYARRRWLS